MAVRLMLRLAVPTSTNEILVLSWLVMSPFVARSAHTNKNNDFGLDGVNWAGRWVGPTHCVVTTKLC